MWDQPVKDVMKANKMITASPETTVLEAAKLMKKKRAGAVLVMQDERLVGIFTERDIAFRVVAAKRDPRTTTLADVLTASPSTVEADQSFGFAMLLMHEKGFRHVPVLEDGRPIGIVSSRSALDPDLEEFACEAQRREEISAAPVAKPNRSLPVRRRSSAPAEAPRKRK
jgi:CBS domain-containing protein